ncbi:MAG: glycosyltransferase, partial [Gemmatimonadales bacterium]
MTPSITVLIPTFNRLRALEAVWPSYFTDPSVARVIVIDDGSTDGTGDRVKEWGRSAAIPVEVIRHATQRGQPASRQTGIAAA